MTFTSLEELMAAGGVDPGISDAAWRDFVEHVAETLDIGPGSRVFDVGCGAGALLFPFSENGYNVGGLDPSEASIDRARMAMPHGRWLVGDAAALDPAEAWDVVVSSGAFGGFPNLDYARGVLARMAAKATHGIAVLGVPDEALRLEAGAATGLLFYERGWFLRMLAEIGASAVQFETPRIAGDSGAAYRFNVFSRI